MWFVKHKKTSAADPLMDAAAQMIAGKMITFREILIRLLQRLEQRFSNSQKKVLFIICCLACGIYCAYVLSNALFTGQGAATLRYEPIQPVAQPPPFYRRKDSTWASHPQLDTIQFKNNKH